MAKITDLPILAARNGSELLVVVSTSSGEPVTYSLSLADLVDNAGLIAFSSTDPTLAANSDELLPTQKATKAFVEAALSAAIGALLGAAPAQLNTLDELAAAINDDANFAAAITAALAGKVSQAQLDAAIAGAAAPEEWTPNFTGAGDVFIPARVAKTIGQGNAAIGVGTVSFAKSTAAAPGVFNATALPAALEAGAWLKVSVVDVVGFFATNLRRTA